LKVFGILKTFSQKGLKRVKGRALAHPLPDKSKFEITTKKLLSFLLYHSDFSLSTHNISGKKAVSTSETAFLK
jgi:hypothetical protein